MTGSMSCWLAEKGGGSADDPPPARCDVAVVGGGVLGVCVAYWLTRRGVVTAMLEGRSPAWGATGRNAGLVLWGRGPLEQRALLEQTLDEEGIEADYRQAGHLALARSAAIWERFQAESAGGDAAAPPRIRALNRAECEAMLGLPISSRFLGGRFDPAGCVIHPVKMVEGLLEAARWRGLTVASGSPAAEIAATVSGVGIRLGRGELRADRVLIACNHRSAALVPELDGLLRPVRGQMLETEPLPPSFRPAMAVDRGAAYWRQFPDGPVILGGCRSADPRPEETGDDDLNPAIQAALEGFLPDNFPALPAPRVRARWAGIMDVTPDGRPLLGPVPGRPRVWVAAGLGGHGLPVALGAGRAIADEMATGQTAEFLEPHRPGRFIGR
jgi:glycine/D-amino acid oxidase-like deaminating enzyme